jgi:hypothetical protein
MTSVDGIAGGVVVFVIALSFTNTHPHDTGMA